MDEGSYRSLRVWQKGVELVLSVYRETQSFPNEERYGLVSQMRRAALSIPSNIAEGKGRMTDRDRAHFFSQARGSLLEVETQIVISERLGYMREAGASELTKDCAEVGRMLNALIRLIKPIATLQPSA